MKSFSSWRPDPLAQCVFQIQWNLSPWQADVCGRSGRRGQKLWWSGQEVAFILQNLLKLLQLELNPNHWLWGLTKTIQLCLIECLQVYLKRTATWRTDDTRSILFLTYVKPHKPVYPPTVVRWVTTVVGAAGLDTTVYKVRGAGTSKAFARGASIHLKRGNWTKAKTNKRFYLRDTDVLDCCASKILHCDRLWTTTTLYLVKLEILQARNCTLDFL